jgi:hypothetical protein
MQISPAIQRELAEREPVQEIPENVIDNIIQALQGLQFGEITITVRNGSITQIDRVARKRQFKSKSD